MTLDKLAKHKPQRISKILRSAEAPDLARQLEEIGFLPGERVMVMARAAPGGDPLVVRVGMSTFALRRVEAQLVQLDHAGSATRNG